MAVGQADEITGQSCTRSTALITLHGIIVTCDKTRLNAKCHGTHAGKPVVCCFVIEYFIF
jgi:hypothetical protein